MEEEAEGVYGYTLTMGDNNWELFQIWLDEDPDQVLHPNTIRAPKETPVMGPADHVRRPFSWYITGKIEYVRLINESQFKKLREQIDMAKAMGEDPPVQEYRNDVAYVDDYKPPGYENASDVSDMPLVELNASMAGKPGDKYRIRYHVRGKYKRIEWTKDARAFVRADAEKYIHKYYIIGDHNYWTFDQMHMDKNEQGLYGYSAAA